MPCGLCLFTENRLPFSGRSVHSADQDQHGAMQKPRNRLIAQRSAALQLTVPEVTRSSLRLRKLLACLRGTFRYIEYSPDSPLQKTSARLVSLQPC